MLFTLPSLWLSGLLALTTHSITIVPELDAGTPATHEVVWSTEAGQYYSLRHSTNLVDWSVLAGYPLLASGPEQRQPVTVTEDAEFFKAKQVQVSDTVSWSIGNASSSIDGGASTGPVTFTWTFNMPVEHGVYLDGTPWVIWKSGLQLVNVSPNKVVMNLVNVGAEIYADAVADATVINLDENGLALDQRMGDASGNGPWDHGTDVWNGAPTDLNVGDCIATGRGRRDSRTPNRRMLFTAIGVCNVVAEDQEGRYRPPIRMPANLRATLEMPREVDVKTLPSFDLEDPKDWSGGAVNMDISAGTGGNPDQLLNGPMGNTGVYSHVWYETANGLLNHNLSGTDQVGYQRNVAGRFATCLYTAFDANEPLDERQRSLNKFIQGGLDYYYMHCAGYQVWNGGGGHPNGIEGIITLTGALLGRADMTDAIKYQRFLGDAIGDNGKVYDMFSGYTGAFSRSEATHLLSPAAWQSGAFDRRPVGNGASTLPETITRMDFAREDMVLNVDDVPFTKLENVGQETAITVGSNFTWPMYSENSGTEARRSYRFLPGGVLRIDGDPQVRKIVDFKQTASAGWSENTWSGVGGKGGTLLVYPPLSPAQISALGPSGTLVTGVSTRAEAESDTVILWESWPIDSETRARKSFISSPTQDYLGIKLADNFYWLPYYQLLADPGAPGKKLYEESPTYAQVKKFVQMQRDSGQVFWDKFRADSNMPQSPVIQALIREYLLDGEMPSVYCLTYGPSEQMWVD